MSKETNYMDEFSSAKDSITKEIYFLRFPRPQPASTI